MTTIANISPSYPARIYLHADTVGTEVHPVDVYREVRALRVSNENLRAFDMFCSMFGNVSKGGGTYTERFLRLNNDCRIVPFDTDHELTITGTLITDDGQQGIACFDRSSLNAATTVDINYVPPQVEIIEVNTGSGVNQSDIDAITAQVWTESIRTLTTNISPQDIADISTAIWAENIRTLTSSGSITQQDIEDISAQVWAETVRSLTVDTGVTTQDKQDIAQEVWEYII